MTETPEAPPPPTDALAPRVGISLHEAAVAPLTAQQTPREPTPEVKTEVPEPAPSPTAKVETPDPAPAAEEKKWSYDDLLGEYGKNLKPGDPRLQQFGTFKDIHKNVLKANEQQALRILELERQVSESAKAAPAAEVSPDIETLRAEMMTLKEKHASELTEFNNWKARQDLTSNEAFRREFDGKRVALLGEARAAAEEAGLEPEKIDGVFEAKSELQIRKAVEALSIEDETAERLILEKALSASSLARRKEEMLSGKGEKPLAELAAEWKGHLAEFGTSYSSQVTTALQGQLIKATEEVASSLAEKSALFRTEHGKGILQSLNMRFKGGYDLEANEVVEALALGQIAPIFERQAMEIAKERDALKAQVASLTKALPGGVSSAGGLQPGKQAATANPAAFDPFVPRTGIDLAQFKR